MTLSVSDYKAKIAASATKANALFQPKIEGAKEPVPMTLSVSDPPAIP